MLLQTGFESVLAEARRSYGMVIVDAPALAAVSDALLIATKVDGSLFVVSPDRTDEKDSQRVFAEMAHVGINNLARHRRQSRRVYRKRLLRLFR